VTEVVEVGGALGLIMDHIPGRTLDDWTSDFVSRTGPPPAAEVLRTLFGQVLLGMGHAHSCGVVHRDIKHTNILLDESGPEPVVRIVDFGLGKILEPRRDCKRLTDAGALLGTPSYMSPEQIRDPSTVDARSDIFSLGATLYRFATGHVAFDGTSPWDIQRRVVDARFEPPEKVHPGIAPPIAAAIVCALAPEKEARFASCREFREALG
jgi:serine/threonine-protein kinase